MEEITGTFLRDITINMARPGHIDSTIIVIADVALAEYDFVN